MQVRDWTLVTFETESCRGWSNGQRDTSGGGRHSVPCPDCWERGEASLVPDQSSTLFSIGASDTILFSTTASQAARKPRESVVPVLPGAWGFSSWIGPSSRSRGGGSLDADTRAHAPTGMTEDPRHRTGRGGSRRRPG